MVALYGPRTTAFVVLDDGVYEFTYKANGYACSNSLVLISKGKGWGETGSYF